MSLRSGHKLAHYEILEPIGRGGMGEVYRAKDAKLGRDVAIKVLPDEFAQDEERLRRFQREAKVLASLNHPNIASIYGLEQSGETHYLVLELVPGETLAERIARGPIPVEEALEIATKIAEALEEAHERGIVHRDLKPANIKLTPEGKVKVLDFGLAKAFAEEGIEGDAATSMSPTITRDATRVGVILGTAAYMSPEQAKGKRVDKRADVWAFGVVLYEMLTGKRAFDAEDVSDTLAYILTKEPNWSALPASVPHALRTFLRRCLGKDPKRRVRDVGDVRLALEGAFDIEVAATKRGLAWPAVVAVAALAAVAVWLLRQPPAPEVTWLAMNVSPSLRSGNAKIVTLSPDGRTVVFATDEGLYQRDLQRPSVRAIPYTDDAFEPVFSPDGQWIAFWTLDGGMTKIPVAGGRPVPLWEDGPWGFTWQSNEWILMGTQDGGLVRISSDGGPPEVVTHLQDGERAHQYPDVLPNGKTALLTSWRGPTAHVVAVSLETGEARQLFEGSHPRYVPTGHIVFARDTSLYGVPFDADRLELTGTPTPLADVLVGAAGGAQFAFASNGTLVLVPAQGVAERQPLWLGRDGQEEPLAVEPRFYVMARISPDGSRVALDTRDEENDIWIWNFDGDTLSRLTFDPDTDSYPVWTPDGDRVAFRSRRGGATEIYWKAADGTGPVERLTHTETLKYPEDFSPDGKFLVYGEGPVDGRDLMLLPIGGEPEPLVVTDASELNADISPDGSWVAYQSDESGTTQIFVRPFPNIGGGKWQVSDRGGRRPLWSRDGAELFYTSSTGALMSVPIRSGSSFAHGAPSTILERRYRVPVIEASGRDYDISPNGERFLMLKDTSGFAASELVVVLNWFEELKQLVPAD